MGLSREDAFILWLMSLETARPWQVLARFGTAEAAFRAGFENASAEALREVVARVEPLLGADMAFVSYKNPAYPTRLASAPDRPLGFFVCGQLPQDVLPAVAIVGTRDNTHYGGRVAHMLAQELAALGIIVISGMARGLDARAHEGALAAGGQTVAVLASGADVCYPAENFSLYGRIKASGCVVSERLPGTKPEKWAFLTRNRIVTALADVLVVVEAAARSGTNSTADHALEQGKEIFAVPGRITDATSAGTNQLLKQGAHICTSHLDIVLALSKMPHLAGFFAAAQTPARLSVAEAKSKPLASKIALASDEALVYAYMSREAVSVDYLAYKTGLKIANLNKILLDMELAGQIARRPGNKYSKI